MADNELVGKLTIDASGVVAMIQRGLNQGAAAIAKWVNGPGHITGKVDIDTTGAKKQLDELSESAGGIEGSFSAIGAGAAALGLGGLAEGIGSIAEKMISGNGEMERYTTQLGTLMGSSDKAKDRLAELAKFGAETPFELPELVRAEKVLIGFGLQGDVALQKTGKSAKELRTIIGDVAAGTGVNFEELAVTFGKFSSGATGEAISRLQELGIVTREQLTAVGVQFSKSGELVSPLPQAMTAAVKIAQEKFGGGMKQLSGTLEGQVSTLNDTLTQGLNTLGAPLFDVAKKVVETINEILATDTFQDAIQGIADFFRSGLGQGVAIFTALVAAGGGLAALFAILAPLLPTLTAAFSAFWTSVTGPIGIAVIAIAALVAGFVALYNNVQPFKKVVDDAVAAVKRFVGQIIDAVLPTLKALWEAAKVVGEFIGKFIILNFKILYSVVSTAIGAVVKIVSAIGSFVGKLFGIKGAGTAASSALEAINKALAAATEFFGKAIAVVDGLSAAFDSFIGTLSEVGDIVANLSFDNLGASLDKLLSLFGDSGAKAGEAFNKGFKSNIADQKLAKDFETGFQQIEDALQKTLTGLGADADPKAITAAVEAAQGQLNTFLAKLTKDVKEVPDDVGAAMTAAAIRLRDLRPKIEEETKVTPKVKTDPANLEAEAAKLADIELKIQALANAKILANESNTRRRELLALQQEGRNKLAEIDRQITAEKSARVKAALERLKAAQEEENQRLESSRLTELVGKGVDDFTKQTEEETKKRIEALRQQEAAIVGFDAASIRRRAALRQEQLTISLDSELSIIAAKSPEFKTQFEEIDRQFLSGAIDPGAYAERIAAALRGATANVSTFKAELDGLAKQLLDGTIKPDEYERQMQEAIRRAIAAADGNGEVAAAIARAGNQALDDATAEAQRRREKDRQAEEQAIASLASDAKRRLAQAQLDAKRARDAALDELDLAVRTTRELAAAGTITAEEAAERFADIEKKKLQTAIQFGKSLYQATYDNVVATNDLAFTAHNFKLALEKAFTREASAEEKKRNKERSDNARSELQKLREELSGELISLEEYNIRAARLQDDLQADSEQRVLGLADITRRVLTAAGDTFGALAERFRSTLDSTIEQFTAVGGNLGDVLLNTATYLGAVVAQAATQNQNVVEAALSAAGKIAFDYIQKLIPVWMAGFLGVSLSETGFIGAPGAIAAWIATTALLEGVVAAARGTLNLNSGTDWVPGIDRGKDSVRANLRPGEAVVQREMNQKHHWLVKAIRRDEPWLKDAEAKIRRGMREPDGRQWETKVNQAAYMRSGEALALASSALAGAQAAHAKLAAVDKTLEQTNAYLAHIMKSTAGTEDHTDSMRLMMKFEPPQHRRIT